ncbi:MAG TPA: tetratricopeptide repeat protein [Gemmataceae bacterium]|nr:tetratricopeptide repeat protein [Gemmataceae bacterium]
MPRRLNVKFLLTTLAALAVLGGAVHWVHGEQMRRNAGVICKQAERALERKDYAKAAELYRHYLNYQPDDAVATANWAAVLEKSATSSQARFKTYLLLEQVLRRQPGNLEVRQAAVQAAIDVGRMPDAIRHLENLISVSADKALLEHRLGWCQEAAGQYEVAANTFRRTIAMAPKQFESYLLLAELLVTRFNEPEQASKVMDAMVAANPASWQVYLARARFQFGKSHVDAAAADIYKACELAPDNNEVLLAAADMAILQGDVSAARHYIARGLELFPQNERLYRLLGNLETQCKTPEDAIAGLRQGLAALPDSVALRIQLAEVLLDCGHANEAREIWHWLKNNGAAPGLADFVEGRILMLDRRWHDAAEKLIVAQAALGWTSEWTGNVSLALGKCYQRLGALDKQIAAYRDAVAANPANEQFQLELSKALLAAKLPEEALVQLRKLTKLNKPPGEAWTLLARAQLDKVEVQPADSAAAWKELDVALAKAALAMPDDAGVVCVHAEALALKGDNTKAVALLQDAVAIHPTDLRPWTALVQMQAKAGQDAAALATLEKALQQFGPRLEICQAVVTYWSARPGSRARAGLAQVGKQASLLPSDDKALLLRELAKAMLLVGDKREAEGVLRQLAALLPRDLQCRMVLFDIVLDGDRDGEAASIVSDIRRIEGEDGVYWRAGDAARAIGKAQKGDNSQLGTARQRLAEIRKRRGDWPRAVLLEAYLEEVIGHTEQAIDGYVKAIALGERPPALVLRIAQWLADHKRFAESGQVLRQLEDQMPLSPEHARLGTEVALQNDEVKHAAAMAMKAVQLPTRDYRELLWLAHVQWLAGQPLEAGQTYRQAIKLAPRIPSVWVALARHLTRTQQFRQLEDMLKEMREAVPANRMSVTMALCLEAAGRHAEAEELYQKALATGGDFETVRQAAEFYLRIDQQDKAEPLLRQLTQGSTLAPVDVVTWARRQLALVLARLNRPGAAQQALALLDLNASRGLSVEDERVRCFVLAFGLGKQAEAARLFEQTLSKRQMTPDEQFMLAQIYDANQDDAKAQRMMRILLAMHRDQPLYIAYQVRSSLLRDEMQAAKTYLGTLEQLEPGSPRTLQLRAAYQKALPGG